MFHAPAAWTVIDRQQNPFFNGAVILIGLFSLPIRFMITGHPPDAALARKGWGSLRRDNVLRLVLRRLPVL
jgi:hypothetical protein